MFDSRELRVISEQLEVIIDEDSRNTKQLIEEVDILIKELEKRKKEAGEEKDLRENSAYQEAVIGLGNAMSQRSGLIAKQSAFETYKNISSRYLSSGFIGLGTTVKLRKMTGNNEIFIIKIVPSFMSNSPKGIVSERSPVGKTLIGRTIEKEDSSPDINMIMVQTQNSSIKIKYKIEDIY